MNSLAPANGAGSWSLFPTRMNFFLAIYFLWMLGLPFLRPLFSQNDAGAFLGFIPFNLFLAMLTASTAREIVTHPFSFTLPLHRHILRRQLLTIAAAGNALLVLPMLLFPAATDAGKAGAVMAFFCAGAALYLGTAVLIFRLRDSTWLSGPMVVSGFLLVGPSNLRSTVLAQHLAGSPLLFLLVAALVLLPFWKLFDDKGRFRRLPGASSLSLVDGMDMRKYREFRYLLEIEGRSGRPVEPAWHGWLADLARGTSSGWLYCFRHQLLHRLATVVAAATPGRIVPFLLMLAVASYMVSQGRMDGPHLYLLLMNLAFSMWMLNLARIDAHNPLLPYSRREMAVADFLLGLVASLLGVLASIAFVVVSWSMGGPGQGQVPVLAASIGVAALFLPLYLGLRLLFGGGLGFGWFVLLIPVQILSVLLFDDYQRADAITLLLLHAGGWLLLVPAVYWRYCRTDLVSSATT